VDNEPYFVRVTKSRDIDLNTAAELAEMDLQEFRMLNPGFNLPIIVASHNSSFLLPRDHVGIFMNNLASWVNTGKPLSSWLLYRVKKGDTLESIAQKSGMTVMELRRVNRIPTGSKVLEGSALLVDAHGNLAPDLEAETLSAKIALSAPPSKARRVVYRVRRGDTIFKIAKRYGITQRSIRQTNKLRSGQLRIGQRLVLSIPAAGRHSQGNKTRRAGRNNQQKRGAALQSKRSYVVRAGESLSSIARKFKTTPQKIRRANGMRTNNVVAGKRIVIP
jgi:membrane-bound lytic murein transglycosylase D